MKPNIRQDLEELKQRHDPTLVDYCIEQLFQARLMIEKKVKPLKRELLAAKCRQAMREQVWKL